MKRGTVRILGAGVAAVLIAVAVIVFLVNRPSSETGPDTAPTPSDTEHTPVPPTVAAPVPPATGKPGRVKGDGTRMVDPFISAETASRTDITRAIDFSSIATGAALEDLKVSAQEKAEDGIVQVGSPKLIKATVTDLKERAKPPTATVRVCLDYSTVDVQAPDGTSVKNRKAPQRVASILVLHEVDGHWLVAKRTFPSKPSC